MTAPQIAVQSAPDDHHTPSSPREIIIMWKAIKQRLIDGIRCLIPCIPGQSTSNSSPLNPGPPDPKSSSSPNPTTQRTVNLDLPNPKSILKGDDQHEEAEMSTPEPGQMAFENQLHQSRKLRADSRTLKLGSEDLASAGTPLTKLLPSPPPWVEYKIDQDALCSINRWNQENPDNKFSTVVLGKVNRILESKVFENMMNFIPDNPVPAKSLVSALVSLALLGTKIPETKQEVYTFAKEVATDISLLSDAFGTSNTSNSPLLQIAWNDLEQTRALVNDICRWADVQLQKTWSDVSGLHQGVGDWRAKLESAKSRFSQRALVHILNAVGTATQSLENINHGLQNMSPYLAELHKDHKIENVLQFIQTELGNHVVPLAKYDVAEQKKKREYHKQTRQSVLGKIAQWKDAGPNSEYCLWITGKVGVGKSTIGTHVAEKSKDDKSLYAQFFISRDIDATTNPDNIFPTMAQQLAERSPLAALVIHEKLKKVLPSHISSLSDNQARAIFIEPLKAIAQYEGKIFIIIDGIDELADTDPSIISEVTAILCRVVLDLPSQVKVLVLSRPEQPIIEKIAPYIKRLELPIEESKADVEQFLSAELGIFAQKYQWEGWPSPEQIRELSDLAAGHLGWAKFAVKWMARELVQSSQKALRRDEVFADLVALPPSDLESLYNLILTRITPTSSPNRERFLTGFQITIGSLAVLQAPQNISTLATLVSFDLESSGLKGFDLVDFLDEMCSLFMDGADLMSDKTVPQAHKSVFDYLTSSRPDQSLQLSLPQHHTRMTRTCFRICREELSFNIGGLKTSHKENVGMQPIPLYIAYACRFLGQHQEKAQEPDQFLSDIDHFMSNNVLQWLEVLSLTEETESAILTLQTMGVNINDKNSSLSLLIQDAIQFVTRFKAPIRTSAPHIYISALPQAPSGSLIRQHYLPQFRHLLSVKGGPKTWDEQPIEVYSAFLSHNGTYIAAIFTDKTLRIFTAAGEIVHSRSMVEPWTVALSHDDKVVASVDDGVLCLWNFVETDGEMKRFELDFADKRKRFHLRRSSTTSGPLSFSPMGTYIAVGCDGNIRVFDLRAGEHPCSPFNGHTDNIISVSYSADGSQIVSCSKDETVRVWNASDGTINHTFQGEAYWNTVSFSPKGTQIVAGSTYNSNIQMWTLTTAVSYQIQENGAGPVPSLAFSQDGRFLVAAVGECVRVWDLSSTSPQSSDKTIGQHAAAAVTYVAFFPDSEQFMSTSEDGTIRVWDRLEEMPSIESSWEDGGSWIFDGSESEGKELIWTPFGVRHPRNILVIGPYLDLSDFIHGEEWVNCQEALST
ncbi:hypothetical protein B0H19DRAFT_1237461 [Mycena capillaripes]|nr:hypothetical protein B0H19DRAFT_1237461 [Mycena capillaripes]